MTTLSLSLLGPPTIPPRPPRPDSMGGLSESMTNISVKPAATNPPIADSGLLFIVYFLCLSCDEVIIGCYNCTCVYFVKCDVRFHIQDIIDDDKRL